MSSEIRKILGANLYISGSSTMGQIDEFNIPTVNAIMQDHQALGQFIKTEFARGIDKMETSFKINSIYPDIVKLFNPLETVELQLRASQAVYSGDTYSTEEEIIVNLRGTIKARSFDAFKQGEQVSGEVKMAVSYMKLTINGTEYEEIDAVNNIYKVNGTDVLANYTSNIGS